MAGDRELKFELQSAEGNAVLQVAGEIDLHTSPDLRSELLEVLDTGLNELVIDLSAVLYIDSSGVGTIVEAKRRADKVGVTLVLQGLQPRVRSVFEITQLDKFFTIIDPA